MSASDSAHGDARSRVRGYAGYTLIELVMSLAITSLIMVAIGSAMMLATRAIPQTANASEPVADAANAADMITADLRYATYVSEWTSLAVTFTVPDRNGDEKPETIRYAWSGAHGDPLTRQYNGGRLVTAANDVFAFELRYDTKLIATEIDTEVESAEELFSVYSTGDVLSAFVVDDAQWVGQYIEPNLPSETISWRVTRAQFTMRTFEEPDGIIKVQLRRTDGDDLPTNIVLGETLIYENDLLTSYTWIEIPFEQTTPLQRGEGVAVVFTVNDGFIDASARLLLDEEGDRGMVEAFDGETSWADAGNAMMLHYVYGTRMEPGPLTIINITHLTGARITLQVGGDFEAPVVSGTVMLNAPEADAP